MMNDQSPARASHLAGAQRAAGFLALTAVVIGVLGLAAAAFDLSYPGIHAIALLAGVSPNLARLYPLIFDAMLVVASAAVLSLRGAGAATRCYAWLSMLMLLCAAAGADALHATGAALPHRSAAATVAIIPWALVLLGFGLLVAMLRQARLRRAQAARARASAAPPTGLPALLHDAASTAAGAAPSRPGTDRPGQSGAQADGHAPELALDAEPGHDDPTSDEAHSASRPLAAAVPRARDRDHPAADSRSAAESPAPIMSAAPIAEVALGRHAGPELASDTRAELGQEGAAEQAGGGRTDPQRESKAERVPETGPALGREAEAEGGRSADGGPGAGAEPGAAGEPGAGGEPEQGMAPIAPFERMWSSPTPPDL